MRRKSFHVKTGGRLLVQRPWGREVLDEGTESRSVSRSRAGEEESIGRV